MSQSNLQYRNYQNKFLEGYLDLSKANNLNETHEINEITSIHVTRIENDIWQPKSEFEFALLMFRYHLNYKLELPQEITFPTFIQVITETHEVFILDNIIKDLGGLQQAEKIIQNKPRHAAGFTAFFHGYRGYIFNKKAVWRIPELSKPYDQRTKYAPMSVLKNAVRLHTRFNSR